MIQALFYWPLKHISIEENPILCWQIFFLLLISEVPKYFSGKPIKAPKTDLSEPNGSWNSRTVSIGPTFQSPVKPCGCQGPAAGIRGFTARDRLKVISDCLFQTDFSFKWPTQVWFLLTGDCCLGFIISK